MRELTVEKIRRGRFRAGRNAKFEFVGEDGSVFGQLAIVDCLLSEIDRLEKLCEVRDWEMAHLVDISDFRKNKEVLVSWRKEPQIDAEEPRATIKITGPQRLVDSLSELLSAD